MLDKLTTQTQGGETMLKLLGLRQRYVRNVNGQDITVMPPPTDPNYRILQILVSQGQLPPTRPIVQTAQPQPVAPPENLPVAPFAPMQTTTTPSPMGRETATLGQYTEQKEGTVGLPLLKEMVEQAIPVYGTVKYWNEMPTWAKGLSVAGDIATLGLGKLVTQPAKSLATSIMENAAKAGRLKPKVIPPTITAPSGITARAALEGGETKNVAYHGTSSLHWQSIEREGLKPWNATTQTLTYTTPSAKKYVYLTTNPEAAKTFGQNVTGMVGKNAKPTLLTVDTSALKIKEIPAGVEESFAFIESNEIDNALREGYDAIRIGAHKNSPFDQIIVARPEKLKVITHSEFTPKQYKLSIESQGAQTAGTTPVTAATPELAEIVRQSRLQVAKDKPGVVTSFLNRIPGIKQALQFERPGLKMLGAGPEGENLLVGMVAEKAAQSKVATELASSRTPLVNQLSKVFGNDVLHGGKSKIPFIGTAEQAKVKITGTLKDIVENPELYKLDQNQLDIIQAIQKHDDIGLDKVVKGYGAEVGRFQVKPNAAYLSNIESKEDAVTALQSEFKRLSSGRGKTRFYQTGRDRLLNDPKLNLELDVQRLLEGQDAFKASAAAGSTNKSVIGGLTKLDVIQKTHPDLYNKMIGLRKRLENLRSLHKNLGQDQADAVDDFLKSAYDDDDLNLLVARLEPTVQRGQYAGATASQLYKEIQGIRAQIKGLMPAWKSANPKPYVLVQEGIYRYFPADIAKILIESRQVSRNPLLKLIDELRGEVLAGDLSPITGIQVPLGLYATPKTAAMGLYKEVWRGMSEGNILRMFSRKALAEDIAADPSWARFASQTGRTLGYTSEEFGGGFLRKVPGWSNLNESMYAIVTRQQKRLWDVSARDLMKTGVPQTEAELAAAEISSRVYPMLNPARLGQSGARAAPFRALLTSISYVRKPTEMMSDAARAYVKILAKQPLTPVEKQSAIIMAQMAASALATSAATAAFNAELRGHDVTKAVKDAINPDPYNSKFLSVSIPGTDVVIPIGGPYRSLFKAIVPQEVGGVPIPFAGVVDWISGKASPPITGVKELIANSDFYGAQIAKGNLAERLLRNFAYTVESLTPLTVGAGIEAARTGMPLEEAAQNVVGQFAGVTLKENLSVMRTRERDASAKAWLQKIGNPMEYKDWYSLPAGYRDIVEIQNPKLKELNEQVKQQAMRRSNPMEVIADIVRDYIKEQKLAEYEIVAKEVNEGRQKPSWWASEKYYIDTKARGKYEVAEYLDKTFNADYKDYEKWLSEHQNDYDKALDVYYGISKYAKDKKTRETAQQNYLNTLSPDIRVYIKYMVDENWKLDLGPEAKAAQKLYEQNKTATTGGSIANLLKP